MKTKKIFPGWLVVLGGLLIMVTIGGVATYMNRATSSDVNLFI